MFPCARCGHENEPDNRVCAHCQCDTSSFRIVYYLPSYFYNEGLRAARERRWSDAAHSLHASHALRPDDVDPLVLLGKVHAQEGAYDKAVAIWERALAIDPSAKSANRLADEAYKRLRNGRPEAGGTTPSKGRRARLGVPALIAVALGLVIVSAAAVRLKSQLNAQSSALEKALVNLEKQRAVAESEPQLLEYPTLMQQEVQQALSSDPHTRWLSIRTIDDGERFVLRGEAYSTWLKTVVQEIVTAVARDRIVDASDVSVKGLYKVRKGDSFWRIAETVYGDGRLWRNIYDANKVRVEDEKHVSVGQIFSIPDYDGRRGF